MSRVIPLCFVALLFGTAAVHAQADGPYARQIADPYTGVRWLLAANAAHPEGPRLLTLLTAERGSLPPASAPPRILIRTGESIVVFQSTPRVNFTLAATAQGAAAAGGELLARLKIGGRLVRVCAVESGRAEYLGDAGSGR